MRNIKINSYKAIQKVNYFLMEFLNTINNIQTFILKITKFVRKI